MNLTKQTSIVAAVLAAFTFSLSAQAAVSVNQGASGLSNETGFTNTGPATSSTNFALINGIQVTAVPEPSSFALLAGMLGMVWVMVRRRQTVFLLLAFPESFESRLAVNLLSKEWQRRFIAQGGRGLYSNEDDYDGGMAIDPEKPNVIYISTNAASPFDLSDISNVPLATNERYEIWQGTTTSHSFNLPNELLNAQKGFFRIEEQPQ